MPIRQGSAVWEGDLKGGKGTVKTESGTLSAAYSFTTRFESGSGTNPEELLAAAHAGCFSMALSAGLGKAGHSPRRIATTARIHLEKQGEGFAITRIELKSEAEIPDIDEATFKHHAEEAKANCPVSKALAGPQITLDATLRS